MMQALRLTEFEGGRLLSMDVKIQARTEEKKECGGWARTEGVLAVFDKKK
jgi:hypothetical protein